MSSALDRPGAAWLGRRRIVAAGAPPRPSGGGRRPFRALRSVHNILEVRLREGAAAA